MNRKLLLSGFIIFSLIATGCGSISPSNVAKEDSGKSRFAVISKIDATRYIAVDKVTGYQYFASYSYGGNYIIGGNVLDENGKPLKFTGAFPADKE